MSIFQSSNIWKRMERARKKAENPDTPEQIQQKQRRSTALWLIGGAVVFGLMAAGVQTGALPLNLENGVILAIVGLYTLYNAVSLGKQIKDGKR